MNAPPFPANPTVGQRSGNWVWNGVRWVCAPAAGVMVMPQVFKASGPYMPSPGLVTAIVECIGGGGGGGAAFADLPGTTMIISGAGGGSGGYSRIALAAALVAGGVNVTVGAGGYGGPSGGPSGAPAQAGGPGGATTFGALCVANGGGGGAPMQPNVTAGPGGAGAVPGTGDLAFPGAAGDAAFWQSVAAGTWTSGSGSRGGWTLAGGAAATIADIGNYAYGAPGAPNTGAGGGGALINQYPTADAEITGGNGGSGICWITEYCWADSSDGGADDCCGGARVAIEHGGGSWGRGFDHD
jgi:hypothetical protein